MKYKLYHGTSSFLSLEAVHEAIKNENKKGTKETFVINADSLSTSEIFDKITSPNLFSDERILLIKRILRNKESKILTEKIVEILEQSTSKDTILIWEDQKVKSNTKYYKFFNNNKAVEEVQELNKRTFMTWLRKKLEENDLKIDQTIIKEFAERTNYDPERCFNEIKKLKLSNSDKIIRKEDIETSVSDTLEEDIWSLIDSINEGDTVGSTLILERLTEQRVDSNFILSMLSRNLRLIYLTKVLSEDGKHSSEISKILRIPPFTTPQLVRTAQKYPVDKIKKLYSKLSNLDYQIKTGRIDDTLGITLICPYL